MRGNLAAITLFDASPPNALRAPSEMSPRRRDGGLEFFFFFFGEMETHLKMQP